MKINATHAAVAVVALFIVYRAAQKNAITGQTFNKIDQPNQWWSYAGSWAV